MELYINILRKLLFGGVVVDTLKVIGSKKRLEILHELSKQDMYVSELMRAVGLDGKTIKHHLDILENKGIVSTREEGLRKYYSLEKEVMVVISPSPDRRYVVQVRDVERG